MTHNTPKASPEEVLAAGSLVEVPVTLQQADAVSQRIADYGPPATPGVGLWAWRIPIAADRLTDASLHNSQLEVHFRYLPDQMVDLGDPVVGLEVVVYDDDGTQLSTQDYGLVPDA